MLSACLIVGTCVPLCPCSRVIIAAGNRHIITGIGCAVGLDMRLIRSQPGPLTYLDLRNKHDVIRVLSGPA
jgi:hypothetical protein